MNGHTAMEDRFDRRELLLHLGDVLDALNGLTRTSDAETSVVRRLKETNSLQQFEFLQGLSPEMTVKEFTQCVASAFLLWPRQLLDAELDRNALASAVQHNLFGGNTAGWDAYVSYVQKKVKWFGTGLSDREKDAPAESSGDVLNEVSRVATPGTAAPAPMPAAPVEKKGWPWPEPRSTS
jgi:hypothetical protein